MIFNFNNEIVSVTSQGAVLPEVKKLKEYKRYQDVFEYVYFMYDRNSIYKNILIEDRRKVVHSDRFSHLSEEHYSKMGENEDVVKLIEKFNDIQFTPNERLLKGIEVKIGEYLTFWNSVKIEDKNHKLVADTIERAEVLMKIKERIDKLISKESSERQLGGTKSKFFEE